jgi:periplasmic protein TonB
MNYQFKAFQLSFLLHSVIIALVIISSTFFAQYKKSIVLDFDVLKPLPAPKKIEDLTPVSLVKTRSINSAAHANEKDNEPPPLPKENPHKSLAPDISPIMKIPQARDLEVSTIGQYIPGQGVVKEGSSGSSGEGSGTISGIGDSGGGNESVTAQYLNENYAYIRDKILRNISYPDEARRKDWQGTVLLSFIIKADGSVRAFKIMQSSGHKLLDRSAVETIRIAEPFPAPPGEAQLIIPISYRLE